MHVGRNHLAQFLNRSLKSTLLALVSFVSLRRTGHLALKSLKPCYGFNYESCWGNARHETPHKYRINGLSGELTKRPRLLKSCGDARRVALPRKLLNRRLGSDAVIGNGSGVQRGGTGGLLTRRCDSHHGNVRKSSARQREGICRSVFLIVAYRGYELRQGPAEAYGEMFFQESVSHPCAACLAQT